MFCVFDNHRLLFGRAQRGKRANPQAAGAALFLSTFFGFRFFLPCGSSSGSAMPRSERVFSFVPFAGASPSRRGTAPRESFLLPDPAARLAQLDGWASRSAQATDGRGGSSGRCRKVARGHPPRAPYRTEAPPLPPQPPAETARCHREPSTAPRNRRTSNPQNCRTPATSCPTPAPYTPRTATTRTYPYQTTTTTTTTYSSKPPPTITKAATASTLKVETKVSPTRKVGSW